MNKNGKSCQILGNTPAAASGLGINIDKARKELCSDLFLMEIGRKEKSARNNIHLFIFNKF